MKVDVSDFVEIMLQEYRVDEKAHKVDDPIGLTIKFIIAGQGATLKTVEAAYNNLKKVFGTWENLLKAPNFKIAQAIKEAGYSNRKTTYIKEFLRFVEEHNWDLSWMKDLPIKKAVEIFSKFRGIQRKDIRYILAFGLGMPAFPADQHIRRVIRRVGILGSSVGLDDISEYFEGLDIPHHRLYLCIKEHANRICSARKPKCLMCPVAGICHSASPSVKYISEVRNSGKA